MVFIFIISLYTTGKLKVSKAYVEPYAGQTDYSATSLHVEGRQVTLQLDTGAAAGLKTVTKLAQCIGVDFIKHNGNHISVYIKSIDVSPKELSTYQPVASCYSNRFLPVSHLNAATELRWIGLMLVFYINI